MGARPTGGSTRLYRQSDEIFGVLKGTEDDFDEQVFDALAEVKLAKWARSSRYQAIQKLKVRQDGRTPEFSMSNHAGVALAEAKHFRTQDYMIDFVCDHLEGLALTTGGLTTSGLRLDGGVRYQQNRLHLAKAGVSWRTKYRELVRSELTEAWLSKVANQLQQNEDQEIDILHQLFTLKQDPSPGRVFGSSSGSFGPESTSNKVLSKF